MKIICMSCPPGAEEVEESIYPEHMQKMHPAGQLASIAAKRNTPKVSNLPPGISPEMLPDPEFMKTVAEIEQAAQKPAQKPQVVVNKESPPSATPVVKKEPQPIELTYKYVGQDKNGHEVTTLEIDVDWKHFVIAFCPTCNKQIESREVQDLKAEKVIEKKVK